MVILLINVFIRVVRAGISRALFPVPSRELALHVWLSPTHTRCWYFICVRGSNLTHAAKWTGLDWSSGLAYVPQQLRMFVWSWVKPGWWHKIPIFWLVTLTVQVTIGGDSPVLWNSHQNKTGVGRNTKKNYNNRKKSKKKNKGRREYYTLSQFCGVWLWAFM